MKYKNTNLPRYIKGTATNTMKQNRAKIARFVNLDQRCVKINQPNKESLPQLQLTLTFLEQENTWDACFFSKRRAIGLQKLAWWHQELTTLCRNILTWKKRLTTNLFIISYDFVKVGKKKETRLYSCTEKKLSSTVFLSMFFPLIIVRTVSVIKTGKSLKTVTFWRAKIDPNKSSL